jgi:response regulator RpfG family c-di-GMP phosphodiesterase
MPEMDGAAFVRTLRQRPERQEVPIIVVTVYEDRDFCYRALEAGATDFLPSPVDHLEFRARARNLLTLERQRRLLADRAAGLEAGAHHAPAPARARRRRPAAAPRRHAGGDLDRRLPGRLVFANLAHAAMLGVSRDAAAGRPLAETARRGLRASATACSTRRSATPASR